MISGAPRARWVFAATVCTLLLAPDSGQAQAMLDMRADDGWAKLPSGRDWGAVTSVQMDPDGQHIWVLDRCGADSCIGSDLHPVFKFDLQGNLVANFGAGVVAWPHGFFVDREGFIWITDGGTRARADAATRAGMGHQVVKLSPEGKVVATFGTPGVTGSGPNTFYGPTDILVGPNGDVYIADGHDAGGNDRVMKFSADGHFLGAWGTPGSGPAAGEMSDPHALAMDSQGRIFVADRRNARIQIFDQGGAFLEAWSQFGPPSDIYIDANDVIYVTDTQTAALPARLAETRDSSWVRGIRIGDARTGRVTGFLPSDAEFVTADRQGNIYGAEVPGERLARYSPGSGSTMMSGDVRITPIHHASVQLEYNGVVVHVDPWSRGDYSNALPADLVLITDTPNDHLDRAAIARIRKTGAPVVIPAAARDSVRDGTVMRNGETRALAGVTVEAIPMYDLIPGDPFHPKGAGNGYIVTIGGQRIYFAGVTECVPEIRALRDIDVAFIPMNLPHGRMTPAAAAECVAAFRPEVAYPYHYRDGNVEEFRRALIGSPVEVRLARWYPETPAASPGSSSSPLNQPVDRQPPGGP